MDIINFDSLSLFTAIIIFIIAAVFVWIAGSKLTILADQFAEQTGVGRAFLGVLLLGGITSLPEIATTLTASLEGDAGMAVSNILGGISMQITILAVVDFWLRKKPLSTSTSNIGLIIQGVLLIVLLSLSGIFMLIPSLVFFHISINSIIIFALFIGGLFFIHQYDSISWISYNSKNKNNIQKSINFLSSRIEQLEEEGSGSTNIKNENISIGAFIKKKGLKLLLLSISILVSGYIVVKTTEVIAGETGISTSFAGLVLVAITTSLPEISTAIGAVRLKRYDMAFGNIFGTNLFDVALIFLADLLFFSGSVFEALDQFTVLAAFLGVVLTGIYVMGIAARSNKRIIGIGYDSLIIILTYIAGIVMLYFTQAE